MKKGKTEDILPLIRARKGECLSPYILNTLHIEVKCEVGHTWKITPKNLKKGHWCPFCAGIIKNNLEEIQKQCRLKGGKCLSLKYHNAHQKLEFECCFGHRWFQKYNNIQQGNWCPICAKPGEKQKQIYDICKKTFKQMNVFYNFRGFEWLKSGSYNRQEIDIFIKDPKSDFSLAIEYDGPQHFKPCSLFGGVETFKYVRRKDREKNKKIKNHPQDVKYFIRFNYKDKITEDFIINTFCSMGIL